MSGIGLLACWLTRFPFGWETEPKGGPASMHPVVPRGPGRTQRYERRLRRGAGTIAGSDHDPGRLSGLHEGYRPRAAHLKRLPLPCFPGHAYSPQAIKSLFLDPHCHSPHWNPAPSCTVSDFTRRTYPSAQRSARKKVVRHGEFYLAGRSLPVSLWKRRYRFTGAPETNSRGAHRYLPAGRGMPAGADPPRGGGGVCV